MIGPSDSRNDAHAWLEQASAYALGALDAREEPAFLAHLAGCPRCQHEVQSMQEVAALMASAPAQLEPPAGLRDRIVDEARHVRPLTTRAARDHDLPPMSQDLAAYDRPTVSSDADRSPSARRASRSPGAQHAQPGPTGRSHGSRVTSPLGWLVAAASIAVAAFLGSLYLRQRDDLRSYAQIDTRFKRELFVRDSTIAARDSMLAALTAPEVQTVTLVASGRPPSARLYVNRAAHRVVLAAFALPPAPKGRIYQLWGLRKEGGSPVSLGLFNTHADSSGVSVLEIPPGVALVASAITEEPAGGSSAPTTTPFLIAQWKGD